MKLIYPKEMTQQELDQFGITDDDLIIRDAAQMTHAKKCALKRPEQAKREIELPQAKQEYRSPGKPLSEQPVRN